MMTSKAVFILLAAVLVCASAKGGKPSCRYVNRVKGHCCVPCQRCCTKFKCYFTGVCRKVCFPLSHCKGGPKKKCAWIYKYKGHCCVRCYRCCVGRKCKITKCLRRCFPKRNCKKW